MHSFLEELDPSFTVCHDFSLLGNATQAARIADALAPNAAIAEPLGRAFVEAAAKKPGRAAGEVLPHPQEEAIAARLQQKLDAFESIYCRS